MDSYADHVRRIRMNMNLAEQELDVLQRSGSDASNVSVQTKRRVSRQVKRLTDVAGTLRSMMSQLSERRFRKDRDRILEKSLDRDVNRVLRLVANASKVESEGLLQRGGREQMGQIQQQVDMNEELIQHRHSKMNKIAEDVQDVHEIFEDLAIMVKDQGVHVESIEGSILSTRDRSKQALNEIKYAAEYQKSGRKRLCLVALGFSIIGLLSAFYVFRDNGTH